MTRTDSSVHALLAWASAFAVAAVCQDAFYAADGVTWARPAAAAVTGAFCLLLTWVASDRGRWVVGGVGTGVLAVGLLAAAVGLSGDGGFADAEGSWAFVLAPAVLCGVIAPLLSRTLAGCALWLVACAFACGSVEALYVCGEVALTAVAVLAAIALCAHCNVCGRVRGAVSTARAGTRAWSSVGVAAGCVALALAAWFGVLAPLGMPTADVTLFEEYRHLPYEFVKGVAEITPTFDFSLKGEELVEGLTYTTDDLATSEDADKTVDARSLQQQRQEARQQPEESQSGGGNAGGVHETIDQDSLDEQFDPASYSEESLWWLLLLLVPLLIAAAIVAFFLLRRRRRRAWLAHVLDDLGPREQVTEMYMFLSSKLALLGFAVPPGMTLAEFSANNARRMDGLRDVTHVPFSEVSDVYQRVAYGAHEPTDEECVVLVVWCQEFWRAARAQLGNLRYFFASFRLNPPRVRQERGRE